MTIRGIRRDDLPRAARSQARATELWSARIGAAPRAASISLNGVGSVSVALAALVSSPPSNAEAIGGPVWFAGASGATFDALAFDGATAHSFCALLLGMAPAPVARPVTALERGMLAALAIPLLGAFGLPGALTLRAPRPSTSPALELALRWNGGAGRAWLVAGRSPLASPTELSTESLDWLRRRLSVDVVCELARTRLSAEAWASAGEGDAVVFPGTAFPASAAQSVALRFGGFRAPACFDDNGDVRLVGAPHRDPELPSTNAGGLMPTENTRSSAATTPDEAAPFLADATVELIAELGRTALRGHELAGLIEGAVLGLGTRGEQIVVTLTCGGRAVARGALVDVEGELGVRLTERLG